MRERTIDVRRTLAIAVPALALVAGCTVGPDYRKPEVDAPPAFQYQQADARDTANTAWWKQFGDPVLDALIDEALANNRNVKIATANVEQAAAVFTQARSSLFPQVGYGFGGARERTSESGINPDVASLIPNPVTAYQAALSVSWELDLWGRIRRQSESARANLLATDEARRGVILSLVAGVATNYLQLRGLDAQLEVAKKTLGASAESVKLFTLQFRYGQVSQMNVAQAKSQYETAAAQIPQIEMQIAQTQDALAILVGRNPGPIARGKPIDELLAPAVPSGLPASLLERRPDLAQAEQQLVAANAQIGAAKALYFPRITLTGALGSASPELADLFKGPARVWSYAGQLAGPIFTFGAVSGQVAQAEAAQVAALQSYQLAIQNAFADVDNALIANAKGREQVAAQERLVAALSDYTRLARLQYNGGYAPYSTVLQAEQALFPAELNLVAFRATTLNTSVSLYKAMGGGWVDVASQRALPDPGPPALTDPASAQPWF
jgi:outer membrane protein, multidrug efflux system